MPGRVCAGQRGGDLAATRRTPDLQLRRRGLADVGECPFERLVSDFLPAFLRRHEVGTAGNSTTSVMVFDS